MAKNKKEYDNWLKIRWLIAFLGIYLLIVGAWKISVEVPPEASPFLLLVAGVLLLLLAFRGVPFLLSLQDNSKETPPTLSSLRPKWQWSVKDPAQREKTVSKQEMTRVVSTPSDQDGYIRFTPSWKF